jgi:predicted porin
MKKYVFLAALFLSFSFMNQAKAIDYNFGYSGASDFSFAYNNDDVLKERNFSYLETKNELDFGGFQMSLHVDLEAGYGLSQEYLDGDNIGSDIYVSLISEDYGELYLGEVLNAGAMLSVSAPDIGIMKIENGPLVDFIDNPNQINKDGMKKFSTLNSTYINTDGRAKKVTYISPEIEGFIYGFSYMQNYYDKKGYSYILDNNQTGEGKVFALSYYRDLGRYELTISTAYGQFDDDNDMSLGVSLSKGNLTLGAGFRKTYVDGGMAIVDQAYREAKVYNIGASYSFGPAAISLSYQESQADDYRNKDKIWLLSGKYTFNKYIDNYVSLAHVNYDGDDATELNNNKGYVVITGIKIKF